MKNHKNKYIKYITLASILTMTMVGIATSPELVNKLNGVKYEVVNDESTYGINLFVPEDSEMDRFLDTETTAERQENGGYYIPITPFNIWDGKDLPIFEDEFLNGATGTYSRGTSNLSIWDSAYDLKSYDGLQYLDNITSLELVGDLTKDGNVRSLKEISEMKNLNSLTLHYGASLSTYLDTYSDETLNSDTFKDFENSNSLKSLTLKNVKLTEDRLDFTKDLKNVEALTLNNIGTKDITKILDFNSANIKNLDFLDNLSNLKTLNLKHQGITDFNKANDKGIKVLSEEGIIKHNAVLEADDFINAEGQIVIPTETFYTPLNDGSTELMTGKFFSFSVHNEPELNLSYDRGLDIALLTPINATTGYDGFELQDYEFEDFAGTTQTFTLNFVEGYNLTSYITQSGVEGMRYDSAFGNGDILSSGTVEFKVNFPKAVQESTPELVAEPLKLPLENREFKGLEELIFEAYDLKDGDLNSKVRIKSGSVDLSKIGSYTLVLEVTNSDGNTAEEQVIVEVFQLEPDVPEIEEPETPEPEVPEVDVPETPEPEPETPDIPEIPEPEAPETEVPETPETPETPEVAEPEPIETPGVPETPEPEQDAEVPETATPDVEKPTVATPDIVVEPEKVDVTNDPKVEPETAKEQAKKETLEVKKEAEKAAPKVDEKAGPDKLLQTDIKPLNPALSLIGGIALVTAGLYFFKKSFLLFKTSIANLKNSKK